MVGEGAVLGFGAALLLGLGFGAGPCNIACLPYLGPVLLASRSGAHDGWRVLLPFSLGRLSGYASVGLVAGLAGHWVTGWLESPVVRWILGGATALVALALWLRLRRRNAATACAGATGSAVHVQPPGRDRPLLPGALFLMGAGMAFNPCAPLGTVMLASAASASAVSGLLLGVGFGFGAVLVPAVVLGLGVAHLGHELTAHLPGWRPAIERLSVIMLMAMGLSTAMGWTLP